MKISNTKDSIKFSIIICTYNRDVFLPLAFESITKQTYNNEFLEVIIIDNNSTDSTEELSNKFIKANPQLRIKYVVEKNQGLSHARNRGIKESSGTYITFMDDDALLADDFSEKTVSFLEKNQNVSAIGGKILLHYLAGKPNWYNPYLASLLGYFNHGDIQKPFKNNYFRGSNMSFRRDLFNKYDAFNTELGRVGRNLAGNEEKELFYRLKNGGEELWYVPSAVVYHMVPESRTKLEFIKQQGLGTGRSQRKMAQLKGSKSYLLSLFKETLKWITSLFLAAGYLLTLRPVIAIVLLKFRLWVSQGLFGKSS